MFDNKTMKSSDEGVSPVIGVILMVAITVILAAVIGTFVLDLAGNLQQNASASVTFEEDSTNDLVTVQLVSAQNVDSVEISDSNVSGTASLSSVGDSITVAYGTHSDGTNDDINATGNSSGTLTATGVLQGDRTVLQTYEYGG